MADGDFGKGGDDEQQTGQTTPSRFAYTPVLQLSGKVGVYDESAMDEEFGLAPFRGQDFAFTAKRVVEDGRTWLKIAALSEPLILMTSGSSASGAQAGLPGTQTDAESSAGPKGGIVRNEATYVTVGMMVERMNCWCTVEDAADVLAVRSDMDFLNGGGIAGPNYGVRLQQQVEQAALWLMDVTGGTRKQIQEHLGPISDWRVNVNGMNIPGHFWMFTSDYGSGGQSSDMELTMTTEMVRGVRIEENAGLPLPVGFQVIVPFRVRHVGYTLCGDPESRSKTCGPKRGITMQQAERIAENAATKAANAAMERMAQRMGKNS